MAAHTSILTWEIPWTEEPGVVQPMGSQKSWTQLSNQTSVHAACIFIYLFILFIYFHVVANGKILFFFYTGVPLCVYVYIHNISLFIHLLMDTGADLFSFLFFFFCSGFCHTLK